MRAEACEAVLSRHSGRKYLAQGLRCIVSNGVSLHCSTCEVVVACTLSFICLSLLASGLFFCLLLRIRCTAEMTDLLLLPAVSMTFAFISLASQLQARPWYHIVTKPNQRMTAMDHMLRGEKVWKLCLDVSMILDN